MQDKGDSANSGTQAYPKRYGQQRKALSVLVCIFFNANFSQLLSLLISYLFLHLNLVVTRIMAMFLVTSPIVINVPTRGLLAVETMHAIVQWLENIKRNMTSMFINKKHRYKRSLLKMYVETYETSS